MPNSAIEALKKATSIGPGHMNDPEIPESELLGRVKNPLGLIQEIAASPIGMMMMGGLGMGRMGGMMRPSPQMKGLQGANLRLAPKPAAKPAPQDPLGAFSAEHTPVGGEWLYNQGRGFKPHADPMNAVYQNILNKGR